MINTLFLLDFLVKSRPGQTTWSATYFCNHESINVNIHSDRESQKASFSTGNLSVLLGELCEASNFEILVYARQLYASTTLSLYNYKLVN